MNQCEYAEAAPGVTALTRWVAGPGLTAEPKVSRDVLIAARMFLIGLEADGIDEPRFVPVRVCDGRPCLVISWDVGARSLVVSISGLGGTMKRWRAQKVVRTFPLWTYVQRQQIGDLVREAGDGRSEKLGWIDGARKVVAWAHQGGGVASHNRDDNLAGVDQSGW